MLHTVEILFPINYQEGQHLFSRYQIKVENFNYFEGGIKKLNKSISEKFPCYTITWLSCRGSVWNLHVKIDILKLLGRSNITEKDYNLVEADIRRFLIYQFGHSTHFDNHTLTRIDYRYDVEIPEEKHRELIFHLFEKYTNKYFYKQKIKWGKDSTGKPLKYETSQYHKNKSVEFIIYDKEEERNAKIKNGEDIKVEHYEKNVIRYELRLKNRHLNAMKRADKGKGRPKKLKVYFNDQLYKQYMSKHILPIARRGDFYKINKAEKIIENSHFTKNKKQKLRTFLVNISKNGIDAPKKYLSPPTYRQYLKDIESLGVNPILIPKNRSDFPSHFKNPFTIK
ncbi:phage/plasmid replication domain-containing protein [Bacillaceae bacterium W0354]